ncbi:MAG TPA: clostripain-related cysteine peptidase [Pseudobdellovibrionaceae bacterium]|nr:clostripain-related cysteine peptidase [Pseudobdellovibrionaceae bacterium]
MKKLNLFFFLFLTFSTFSSALAVIKNSDSSSLWKVAILFLDTPEDPQLQTSILENLKEVQGIKKQFPSDKMKLKVLHAKYSVEKSFSESALKIKKEIKEFFISPSTGSTKTLFIIYGHGKAYDGLGPFSILELKEILVPTDILWLDSCFMSNLEVAYELRKYYRYLLASEDSEISSGIPYNSLLRLLKTQSPEQAAFQLAEDFVLSYSKAKKGQQSHNVIESAMTISVIDTSTWSIFLKYFIPEWAQLKKLALKDAKKFKSSIQYATMDDPQFIDLGSVSKLWGLTDLSELLDVQMVKQARLNHEYDYVFLKSTESDNPVKFIGYTLRRHGLTKTYTGLSIANPLFGHSFNYLDLELSKKFPRF